MLYVVTISNMFRSSLLDEDRDTQKKRHSDSEKGHVLIPLWRRTKVFGLALCKTTARAVLEGKGSSFYSKLTVIVHEGEHPEQSSATAYIS